MPKWGKKTTYCTYDISKKQISSCRQQQITRWRAGASTLTIGTGSLQVWDNSEDVIHQVWPLLALQYAACGGVGWVYVRQVGQVHPWDKAKGGEKLKVLHPHPLSPHTASIDEPCRSDQETIAWPSTSFTQMLLSQPNAFSIHNKRIDTKKMDILKKSQISTSSTANWRAAVDFLLWKSAGNHRLLVWRSQKNENHT